jgi:predicted acetyltransferase
MEAGLDGRVVLVTPSVEYVDSFFAAMEEFRGEGLPQISEWVTRETFPAYVQGLHDLANGVNLKEGYIPSKEFWIVDAEGYAGRIILGLTYSPSPERVGHHVGYAIRPSRRLRGYATLALRLLLSEARGLGITRLMPSCDAENVGSRKVIERNGGVMLNKEVPGEGLRFLIEVEADERRTISH